MGQFIQAVSLLNRENPLCCTPLCNVGYLSMKNIERFYIRQEVIQRQEEGCEIGDLGTRVEAAIKANAAEQLAALYDELDALEPTDSFSYQEPSTLAEIKALRPDGPRRMTLSMNDDELYDRVHGGWLGRAAGCSLGKPVEGWPRDRIDEYLESHDALPLDNYLPYDEAQISPGLKTSTRDNIDFMARDDDMDYPILGLIALEQRGAEFSPRAMANVWMDRMPVNLLYTAERAAYRNFAIGYWPPESASFRNPHREWIGAQIRADIFGYTAPGWPEKAAEFAFRDASISHVKNGIYGEMFVAAMLAAAYVTDDIVEIINVGLSEIPANCRLAEAIRETLAWCQDLGDWEAVWDRIKARYGHYSGVHTINNAALVVLGLYFGNTDFENGIVVSVRGGWDTDCNGATVGSILGLKFGADKLPGKWIGVLNDRLMSSVRGFNDNRISDLAKRTTNIAKAVMTMPDDAPEIAARPEKSSDSPFIGNWIIDQSYARWVIRVNPDLSGTYEDGTGYSCGLERVTAEGNRVSFSFVLDKGGFGLEVQFEGTIVGNRLEGVGSGNGFEFGIAGEREGESQH
jgi:ADP-ribosylglycohydrolase